MEEEFKTSDLGLSATLVYLKFPIMRMERESVDSERKLFIFWQVDELNKVVKTYWNREIYVEPMEFMSILKQLKGRIHST